MLPSIQQARFALVNKLKKKFVEEAEVLCQFQHPNMVHVHDEFEENDTAYYVCGLYRWPFITRDG